MDFFFTKNEFRIMCERLHLRFKPEDKTKQKREILVKYMKNSITKISPGSIVTQGQKLTGVEVERKVNDGQGGVSACCTLVHLMPEHRAPFIHTSETVLQKSRVGSGCLYDDNPNGRISRRPNPGNIEDNLVAQSPKQDVGIRRYPRQSWTPLQSTTDTGAESNYIMDWATGYHLVPKTD